MNQRFNAAVHDGVAGRDYNKTVVQFPGLPKPESQIQDEFAKRTGIWCYRGAREQLETLLHDHDFTVRELAMAWRASSLSWDPITKTLRVCTPMLEVFGAGLIIALAHTLLLSFAMVWVFSIPTVTPAATVLMGSVIAAYVSMMWFVSRRMIWPRRVALRVQRALDRSSAGE